MTSSSDHKTFVLIAAVDFDELSDRTLQTAATLARRSAPAALHVIHVVPPPAHDGRLPELLRDASAKLSELVSRSGIHDDVGLHVRVGSPSEVLEELARELRADILIVGARGRRGAARLVVGSVADRVVHDAPCSVLVVRDRELGADERIEPPCPDCVAATLAAGAPRHCARHQNHHPHAHTYHASIEPADIGMGMLEIRPPGE